MTDEQFLTIPELPMDRGVRDAMKWTIDVLAKEIESLQVWKPTIEVRSVLPRLHVMLSVSLMSVKHARSRGLLLSTIGRDVAERMAEHIDEIERKTKPTKEGNT